MAPDASINKSLANEGVAFHRVGDGGAASHCHIHFITSGCHDGITRFELITRTKIEGEFLNTRLTIAVHVKREQRVGSKVMRS